MATTRYACGHLSNCDGPVGLCVPNPWMCEQCTQRQRDRREMTATHEQPSRSCLECGDSRGVFCPMSEDGEGPHRYR